MKPSAAKAASDQRVNNMEKIILASSSPRRSDILRTAGIPFEVITSDADEICPPGLSPDEYTVTLALRKLNAVYETTKSERLILAADTVVAIDGLILGKPEDGKDAFTMLSRLSGRVHHVYTGIAMKKGNILVTDCGVTAVKMRELTEEEIRAYIATGEPFGKAGSYAVQERGGALVESVSGNYQNVVGLPIDLVLTHLKDDFGIGIFS